MKLAGILFLMIISFNAFAFETDFAANADTNESYNIAKSKYKLSKQEFLDKYGDNDTIVEIINLYFRKRNIAYINPEFLATLPVIGVAISYDSHECNKREGPGCFPVRSIMAAQLVVVSIYYCAIRFPINLTKYSKLNLYLEIEKYRKTGEIKPKTWRKISRRFI